MKSKNLQLFLFIILLYVIEAINTTDVFAQEAKNDTIKVKESVFDILNRDPYLKRYGDEPGKGWIPLFETNTELRFTGFIQMAMLHDFQHSGFPYQWFVPAMIPVPHKEKPNTEFDFRASRVAFESRTNTKKRGSVKTMIEFDFYGNLANPLKDTDPNFRLRQAYVSWIGKESNIAFTLGQAWSTFADLEVWPMILDMQGPNAMTGARQGLVRGSYTFADNLIFDLSFEQPITLVQNGSGLRNLPDFASRLKLRGENGHLQAAGLLRQLMAENTDGSGRASKLGYGISFSGSLNVPGTLRDNSPVDNLGSRQDKIQFQAITGSGLGRYVNDLTTTFTPQDAVYDAANQSINTIPAFGGFAAFIHWWTDYLRSQIVYSVLSVDNLNLETDDALHKTTYALVNLSYTLFERMDIAVEYLYGQRENKIGEKGHANRIQLGFNYGF